jgi:hypothetical protein
VHWVFITHPNEFLRSTSTAKVAAQALDGDGGTTEFLVYGAASHEARVDAALHAPLVRLLFPAPQGGGESVPEVFAEALAIQEEAVARGAGGGRGGDSDGARPPVLTLIVPDGPWDCTRALVRVLEQRAAAGGWRLRRMVLDDAVVSGHQSQLIEALQSGAGRGRVSTLEACALCLSEVPTRPVRCPTCYACFFVVLCWA